jgi:hypothetical protein
LKNARKTAKLFLTDENFLKTTPAKYHNEKNKLKETFPK